MRVFSFFLAAILLYWIIACNGTGVQAKSESNPNDVLKMKDTSIDFYQIDRVYMPYLPDTTLKFNTRGDLKDYFLTKSKDKKKFEDSLSSKLKGSESWILQMRTSAILFDERMEYLYFKTLQNQKKDISVMGLLGYCSPYSNMVSIEDRINFYNSFPENIKQSEIGKKTFSILKEYQFQINVKKTNFLSAGIKAKRMDNKDIHFGDILKSGNPYYLVVFGASWCRPCIMDEMQLKYWYKHFDSTNIKVVGVSVDENTEKWKNYIKKENFPWENYLLENGMENFLVKSLSFKSIPRNFLLDNKGVIIAENTDLRQVLKVYFHLKSNNM
jgi:peroxiredoxin